MNHARKEYIKLLLRNAEVCTPVEPVVRRNATFNGELVDAGYVRGVVRRDENGVINGCVTTGMTVQGRLLLEELQLKQKEESFWGRFKTWGFPIISALVGYTVAVVTPVLSEWLKLLLPSHHS
jgi:hypothetical protein